MQTKFKRHDKVTILVDPDPEYIEYHDEFDEKMHDIKIKKGMRGKINMLLSNGQYHVEILDDKDEVVAYVALAEDDLKKAD